MMNRDTVEQVAAALFLLWIILLLPWLIVATVSLMAFDAGPKFAVYVFVWSIWTYPLSVGIVWWLRQDRPLVALLPLVNIAVWLISGYAT